MTQLFYNIANGNKVLSHWIMMHSGCTVTYIEFDSAALLAMLSLVESKREHQ